MKKLLIFLSLILIILSVSINCNAEVKGTYTKGKLEIEYSIYEDGNLYISNISCPDNIEVNIPKEINGYKVSGFRNKALHYIYASRIVIPEGIDSIPGDVFMYAAVGEISFPSTAVTIGFPFVGDHKIKKITISPKNPMYASVNDCIVNKEENKVIYFPGGNTKKTITTPKGIGYIEPNVFAGNKYVTKMVVSEGVNRIDCGTFDKCENLAEVELPQTLEYFYDSSDWKRKTQRFFNDCPKLESIKVAKGNPVFSSEKGMMINKETGELLLCPKKNKSKEITIPKDVKEISPLAFYECENLRKVHIPGTVEIVDSKAFCGCISLKEIIIDEGVKYIAEDAFADCYQLKEIKYPEGVILFSEYPEEYSMSNVKIPDGMTEIEDELFESKLGTDFSRTFFWGEAIKTITIPDSVNTIGTCAFAYSSLTDIVIPDSVTTIKSAAFYCCFNLEKAVIPSSVIDIEGTMVFENCPKLTVEVEKDSYAEKYCVSNNLKYRYIGELIVEEVTDEEHTKYLGQCSIRIKDVHVRESDCRLYVDCEFTNNSENTLTLYDRFSFFAKQGESDYCSLDYETRLEGSSSKVHPDQTREYCAVFKYKRPSKIIEFKIIEYNDYKDEEPLMIYINPQTGEWSYDLEEIIGN